MINRADILHLSPGIFLNPLAISPNTEVHNSPTYWDTLPEWADENGFEVYFDEVRLNEISFLPNNNVLVHVIQMLIAHLFDDPQFCELLQDDPVFEDYVSEWENEDCRPRKPIILEWEGHKILLDGHHRYCAHFLSGRETMTCEVWFKPA